MATVYVYLEENGEATNHNPLFPAASFYRRVKVMSAMHLLAMLF